MFLQALILAFGLWASTPTDTLGNGTAIPEWENADALAAGHRDVWSDVLASLDVDAKECEAIVFPELLRYNRIKDGVEHAVLLAPYIQGGTKAANFSVGMFQMKPSFAEEVEAAWMQSPLRHKYGLYFNLSGSKDARKKRIERLGNEQWQCVYLAVFVRMMLEREPSLAKMSAWERVGLLATAYNYSFTASIEQLQERMKQQTFHLDFIKSKSTVCYSYADLAVQRFKELEPTE